MRRRQLTLRSGAGEIRLTRPPWWSWDGVVEVPWTQYLADSLPQIPNDVDELRAKITPRTYLLLNAPTNPTGMVLTTEEQSAITARAIEHDLLIVTDEVYEYLVYEGTHRLITVLPGVR